MTRWRRPAQLGAVLLAVGLLGLAWLPVTTRQGIDGKVSRIRLPLWVKTAEFLVRDYHYRRLAQTITGRAGTPQEKVLVIFEWVRSNLRPQPRELRVVDDHIYTIIVRGYGTPDQFADVMATLCAYAGVPAMRRLVAGSSGRRLNVTMVRIDGRWCPFDPYRGVFFQHPDGRFVSLEELINDPRLLVTSRRGSPEDSVDYGVFIRPGLGVNFNSPRPYNQMPWIRLWQMLAQRFGWTAPVPATR